VTLSPVSFAGHTCVHLGDGTSSVIVTTSIGPRVIGLFGEGENLFAELPDEGLDCPGVGRFRFVGGHRLWAAPEVPAITYQPDEGPCDVTEVDDGVRVEARPDGAGLVKSIQIRRTAEGWTVDHVIGNAAGSPVVVAPWAITQLRTGGEVAIPDPPRGAGPQADRSVVFWPYTDPGDPRLRHTSAGLEISAGPGDPIKVGVSPGYGRMSYRLDGQVFGKHVEVDPDAPYPDLGAALQTYICDAFCELETVGSLRTLEPGESASHQERWTLSIDPAPLRSMPVREEPEP
jgi:hypothetical protein